MAKPDTNHSFHAMTSPLRIGLLLYPACMPAGLFASLDLLHAANRLSGKTLFDTCFVGLHTGNIECAHRITLTIHEVIDAQKLDVLLIPGFWSESPAQAIKIMEKNSELIGALKALPKRILLWSYCTGVCLLAASRKLDGQAATVTWWMADTMYRQYKNVVWENEKTCIVNKSTATASGVNGYLPIIQTLIEQKLGVEAFRELTRLMVLPRPEKTHIAFQSLSLIEQPDHLLQQLHTLVKQLPASEITVQRLAEKMNIAERTLARKVNAASGVAIATYARRIKLHQAGERLILSPASASSISMELGFSNDSSMRRMFKQVTGMTPLEYRQTFGRHS